jgi:hypothetical protein
MQIAELVLLPIVRNQSENVMVAAPGTISHHQIKYGTGKTAHYSVEFLFNFLVYNV